MPIPQCESVKSVTLDRCVYVCWAIQPVHVSTMYTLRYCIFDVPNVYLRNTSILQYMICAMIRLLSTSWSRAGAALGESHSVQSVVVQRKAYQRICFKCLYVQKLYAWRTQLLGWARALLCGNGDDPMSPTTFLLRLFVRYSLGPNNALLLNHV